MKKAFAVTIGPFLLFLTLMSQIEVLNATAQTYAVGGEVQGLSGPALTLTLAYEAPLCTTLYLYLLCRAESIVILRNGDFKFPTKLDDNTAFVVSIAAQPAYPAQNCEFEAGTNEGTINGHHAGTVHILCTLDPTLPHVLPVNPNLLSDIESTVDLASSWSLTFDAVIDASVSRTPGSGSLKFEKDLSQADYGTAFSSLVPTEIGNSYIISYYMKSDV